MGVMGGRGVSSLFGLSLNINNTIKHQKKKNLIPRKPRAICQIVRPQFLVEPESRQTGKLSRCGDLALLLLKLG